MTVKSVLKMACYFLGLDEIAETNVLSTSGLSPNSQQNKEIDILLRCLNLVVQDIATSYINLLNKKTITFKNNEIPLSEIDENFLEAISVSVNGSKIKFKTMIGSLYANAENAEIIYRKYPENLTIEDNCPCFDNRVALKTLALGTAMEYSFLNSLSDEASIFENRYKQDLLIAMRKNSEKKIKERRWL